MGCSCLRRCGMQFGRWVVPDDAAALTGLSEAENSSHVVCFGLEHCLFLPLPVARGLWSVHDGETHSPSLV